MLHTTGCRINTQPPEKVDHCNAVLDVHSIFETIQGEGPYSGTASIFIRLAGCNLDCPLCDTDYTKGRRFLDVDSIVDAIKNLKSAAQLIVITGGEPFRQNITPLVDRLYADGYRIQIETNGTVHLVNFPFWKTTIVCSPKTPKIHPVIEKHVSAYKYVLSAGFVDTDYIPLKVLGMQYGSKAIHKPNDAPVFVQPCDTKDKVLNQRNLDICIKAVKEKNYTLNLQLHKIIGVD